MKSKPSTDPPHQSARSPESVSRRGHASAHLEHEGGHGPPKKAETALQIAYLSLKVVEAMTAILHGLL